MSRIFTTFDGEVVRTTDMAVLFRFKTMPTLPGLPPNKPAEVWIPRSCCDDGDMLEEGDTDIRIADWFCEKEGLA